jgi:glycosyltransferase involved in cell wall biosynthesis
MAKIYSAMDVLLNPAMGEGFGITVLEAQACGTPAIVTDFSAMTEVCGGGLACEVGHRTGRA